MKPTDRPILMLTPAETGALLAVQKYNCRVLLEANAERIRHFAERAEVRGLTPADAVIVLINVDAPYGAPFADALMPGHDWQSYRDRGETPIARGLAGRDGVADVVRVIDKSAADKLDAATRLAVVVVDCGTVEVFGVESSETCPK